MNRAQKVDEKSGVICLIIMFPTRGVIIKISRKASVYAYFPIFPGLLNTHFFTKGGTCKPANIDVIFLRKIWQHLVYDMLFPKLSMKNPLLTQLLSITEEVFLLKLPFSGRLQVKEHFRFAKKACTFTFPLHFLQEMNFEN